MKRSGIELAFRAALWGALISVLAVAPAQLSARHLDRFTGTIHDNKCVGPACATMCPVDKDPVYTLQTPDRAWVLSDTKLASELAAKFAGQKVTIKGSTRGNRLRIASVTPAN